MKRPIVDLDAVRSTLLRRALMIVLVPPVAIVLTIVRCLEIAPDAVRSAAREFAEHYAVSAEDWAELRALWMRFWERRA